MPHRLFLTGFVLSLCAAPLGAQTSFPPRTGSEVRIETTTGRLYRGVLQEATRDSLRLLTDGPGVVISLPVTELDTYSVLQTNRRHGAWRGFLIGGAAGLALVSGLIVANRADVGSVDVGILAALSGGLLGSGIGAGFGAVLAPTRWSEPTRLQTRRSSGLNVGLRITF